MGNNDLTSTLTSTGMKGGKQERRLILSEGEKMAAGCEKLDWKMEKGLLRKVQREHSLFKYQMLFGTNREIYDSCNKICFYEKLMEYFLYKEDIGEEIVEAGLQAEDLLDELYHVYLKYEWR